MGKEVFPDTLAKESKQLPDGHGIKLRSERTDFVYSAQGSASVGAGAWVTLASMSVADGIRMKLLFAEGDFSDFGALNNNRGIRIRQGTTVRAIALSGADSPNPDITGLVLENTSGDAETWDIQGRHASLSSQTMIGWFSWVDIT